LTLNFVATDKVGIKTTASLGVRIDDQPPWVSLTAGPIRELTAKPRPNPDECSGPFDPLGDAPNADGTVEKAMRLRALAWDRARQVSGQQLLHYSLVDETSVDMVVQHNTSVPLLINSRGIAGGPCDAVNLRPAGNGTVPVVIELEAIPPTGAAPLGGSSVGQPPVFVDNLAEDPNVSSSQDTYYCAPKSGTPPLDLCSNRAMTRIIKHAVPGNHPVIFGINYQPTTACTGDYYSNPAPGPLCMLAQARDHAGNTSFSWPIRLCVEYADGEDNVVTCPPGALDGITCTDGWVLPATCGPNAPNPWPSVIRPD
jgi:hypothetical protein